MFYARFYRYNFVVRLEFCFLFSSIVQQESEWRDQVPYSEKELEDAVDTLSLLLSQSQQVSLDMFLTLQLSLHPLPSSGQILIRAGAVLSGGHLQLTPISPIPLLPTALARNLTGISCSDIQSKPGFSHSGLSLLVGFFLLFQNLNYVKNSKSILISIVFSYCLNL